MPFAEIPGGRLWFTDSGGDTTPVVFLHAASGNTDCWVHQEPAVTGAGFRCVAYDRRNWGNESVYAETPRAQRVLGRGANGS